MLNVQCLVSARSSPISLILATATIGCADGAAVVAEEQTLTNRPSSSSSSSSSSAFSSAKSVRLASCHVNGGKQFHFGHFHFHQQAAANLLGALWLREREITNEGRR